MKIVFENRKIKFKIDYRFSFSAQRFQNLFYLCLYFYNMNDLKISFIQSDLIWENPEQNIADFDSRIATITEIPDIIILPEMFNTAFSINPDYAETMTGKTINWMKTKASECNCVVAGSLLIKENGMLFNRLVWMQANGNCFTYDKRHLFRMSEEFKIINRGNKKTIVELNGWKINLNICYDLRFPVWTKNTFNDYEYEYDLLINVANWPASRSLIWQTLLKARAIENQAYVVGINRIGKDGFGTSHSGDSMIIDPIGNVLLKAENDKEVIQTLTVSKAELIEFRAKFTVGLDWDKFEISY